MRVLLAPALALLLGTAVFAVAADDVPAPISATLEQNSNIRFGPTTSAHIVVLLKAGEEVEVFGESKSAPDWYVIRFPKQGKVWIHTKNLKALDGGARWQITEDKTRARVDSTLGADVVAELNKGEIVEDKGLMVGNWRAVYIPDAVAYVAKKLVNMPAGAEAKWQQKAADAAEAEKAWADAVATYTGYVEQVKASPKAAIGLDWAGLVAKLDVVIAKHASANTRMIAKRLRDNISETVKAAIDVAPSVNQQAPAPIPPPSEVQPPTVVAGPAKPVEPGARPTADPVLPPMPNLPPPPPPSPWQAQGILVEDDQYQTKVGTRDVLMDGDGNVQAFIKAKDGVDLKLSELIYREVGAKGEVLIIPPEQSGLAKPTKLVVAVDVAPLRP